jgi:NitT/TauT family transport system substrate-binding protein
MRSRLGILTLLLSLASLTPAGAATHIGLGYIPAGDFIPVYVAIDKGFFKDQGLDVTATPIPLASNVPAALVSGSINIGMTTTPIFLQARENGIDLVAISGLVRERRDNPQLSLLVHKGSPITKPKDLEGKTIAFPGLKSLFDTALTRWLTDHGVDVTKVKFVEAQMPVLGDLLRSGNVDAIAIIDPFRAKLLADGVATKISDYLAELRDNGLLAFWITSREWAEKNRPAVASFRKALAQGLDFIKAHPDEARDIGAKWMKGLRVGHFTNWSLALTPADLEPQAKMELDLGILHKPADVDAAVLKD